MIGVVENAEAIHEFTVRPAFKKGAPPRHQNDEGVDPSWSAKANTCGFNLFPPTHDRDTEAFGLETIVSLVFVGVSEKY